MNLYFIKSATKYFVLALEFKTNINGLDLSGGEISEFNYFVRPKNNLKKLLETWKVLLVFNYIVHYQSKKQLLWNQTLHIWQT